jgi:D-glycero-D-manno-heptose 1,7-bisphosphate phosphatase
VLGFSPRGLDDRVIEVDEYCRPCSLHGRKPCYREERFCFTRISPEYVARLAGEMLDTQITRSPALIVDRDGTVMVDKHFLSDPRQVELIDGSTEALRRAGAAGYKIVIISNQSGVARGYFGIEEVERVNARLLQVLAGEGVHVDAIYYCPHHSKEGVQPEFSIDCNCRKPGSGMAERAAAELGIDLRRSMVVGDSLSDLYLGRVIGCPSLLVRTGYGAKEELKLKASGEDTACLVFDNLFGAIEYSIGANMQDC